MLQALKEIFVVDGNLRITPAKIPASVWKRKEKIFGATVNSFPVIVMRGSWNRLTTYAGFEKEGQAKDFKKAVQLAERARRKRKKRV